MADQKPMGLPARAVNQAAAEAKNRAEAEEAVARVITVADPLPEAKIPSGQRRILGYVVRNTFSDVSVRPHRILRAGTIVDDRREVERLARLGALLDPVEEGTPEEAPDGVDKGGRNPS